MVDGYATHLNARKELSESSGGVGIVTTFASNPNPNPDPNPNP